MTEAGLIRLRTFLSEVPAERFASPLKVADIPRLFTPETFCKLCRRAQQRAAGHRGACPGAGRAQLRMERSIPRPFTFVDRITALEPGVARTGHFTSPGRTSMLLPPRCAAEAVRTVGRLGGDGRSSVSGFGRSPVLRTRPCCSAPGEARTALELAVEFDSV